jgi:hypothetical protein
VWSWPPPSRPALPMITMEVVAFERSIGNRANGWCCGYVASKAGTSGHRGYLP